MSTEFPVFGAGGRREDVPQQSSSGVSVPLGQQAPVAMFRDVGREAELAAEFQERTIQMLRPDLTEPRRAVAEAQQQVQKVRGWIAELSLQKTSIENRLGMAGSSLNGNADELRSMRRTLEQCIDQQRAAMSEAKEVLAKAQAAFEKANADYEESMR